ncbi:MAG: cell surface ecto-5'-nucleotidase Nt5e [Streptococcus sp.]|nr:cell surface ecto-5'-nucleotidase Nt5e [Streptococcus sp.]
MKKKSFILPILSTLLLAPALLSHHVYAEEATTTSETETSKEVSAPVTSDNQATETSTNEARSSETAPASETTPTTEENVDKVVAATSSETNLPEATILHTNDVHGRIVEEKGVIGDAKLATVIKEERAKNPNVLVVDAGDAFQGLPISNSSKGEERAKILNEIGYDAMAVGNHEFDFGLDEAKKYKEILKFPLLSSNTYLNDARVFQASTIIDKDKTVEGDEFVVIGVTTPETATKTHPKNIQGVTFKDPITEVNKVIDEIESRAQAEGKVYNNYVILAHLGVDTTTPEAWRGSTLAQALSNNEKLKGKRVTVIDGHSHTVESTTYGANVTYNQTGSYLHNIGKVTFKSQELLGNPQQISAASLANTKPDETIAALVSKIKENYDKENAVVIVPNSPVELSGTRENVRVRETNLGNVVADSLYQYGQTGFANKTDLAVTNGGGLRETIAKDAPITKGNIIAVLPFGNTISQIKVSGQNIMDMFTKSLGSTLQEKNGQPVLDENGQPLLEASGGFLHISGAKVYYDTTLPADSRILYVEIKNKETGVYEPLDLNKTYYLATNDFLAAGGDGYTMLGGPREEGPSMDVAFADFLAATDLTAYAVVNPNSRTISISSTKDSDGDGYTDIEEIQKGTDPNNASSFPTNKEETANKKENQSLSVGENGSVAVPVRISQTFTSMKDPAGAKASNDLLPSTGTKESNHFILFGIALSFLGIIGLRKSKKETK